MRKIITGNVDGRSRAIINEEIPADAITGMIWDTSPAEPLGVDPAQVAHQVPALAPGHTSWRLVLLPPATVMREWLKQGIPGLDARGFHCTATIDYVVVLDGPVTLALDDEEVELQPGDVVVQRQTNHAWFNHNDFPIRLLCLLAGVKP